LLSKALDKAKNFQKTLKVSKELVEGRPAEKIVETAKKGMFDLIVVGSRGLSGFKEIFLGSVSNRVADKAHCPVLIVK
jgi:nucleotide-binding universal stress UspA family protein